jgi:hypothetical protein
MSIELQCYILEFQARSLYVQHLLQAERVKEYEAEWLDSGKTINRDQGGKFAKKIDNLENYKIDPGKALKEFEVVVDQMEQALKNLPQEDRERLKSYLLSPENQRVVGDVSTYLRRNYPTEFYEEYAGTVERLKTDLADVSNFGTLKTRIKDLGKLAIAPGERKNTATIGGIVGLQTALASYLAAYAIDLAKYFKGSSKLAASLPPFLSKALAPVVGVVTGIAGFSLVGAAYCFAAVYKTLSDAVDGLDDKRFKTLIDPVLEEAAKNYDPSIPRNPNPSVPNLDPLTKLGDIVAQIQRSATAILGSIQKSSDITREVASNLLLDPKFRERAGLVAGMGLSNAIKTVAEYAKVNPEFIAKFDHFNERCLDYLAEQYSDTEIAQFLKPDPIPKDIPFEKRLELQAAQFQGCKEFLELPRTEEEKIAIAKKAENLAIFMKTGVGVITSAALAIAPEVLFGILLTGGTAPSITALLMSFIASSGVSFATHKTLDLFHLKDDSTVRHIIQGIVDIGSAFAFSTVALAVDSVVIKPFVMARKILINHQLKDSRIRNLPGISKKVFVDSLTHVFKLEESYRWQIKATGVDNKLIDDAIANSKKILDKSRLAIRVPDEDILDKILDNRFMSTFENKARNNIFYMNARKSVEKAALGIKDIPDDERPIYGFLVDGKDPITRTYVKEGGTMDGYGNVSVLINDALKKTSFFSATDTFRRPSASSVETSGIMAFLPLDPDNPYKFTSKDKDKITEVFNMIKNSKTINDLRKAGSIGTEDGKLRYLEFQTFGKVLGSDITDIVFHNGFGDSANYRLSQKVFGEDSITTLIQNIKKRKINIFHDKTKDIEKVYKIEKASTLREAAFYNRFLRKFDDKYNNTPHSIKKQKDIIHFRHNLLLSLAQNLNNYKYKSVLTKNTKTFHALDNSVYNYGIQRKIDEKSMFQYNVVMKKIINQVKAYDPNFFDDFESYTGWKVDFDIDYQLLGWPEGLSFVSIG